MRAMIRPLAFIEQSAEMAGQTGELLGQGGIFGDLARPVYTGDC